VALATSTGGSLVAAATAGVGGALVGTFTGYNIRHVLVACTHLPDFEDDPPVTGGPQQLPLSRLRWTCYASDPQPPAQGHFFTSPARIFMRPSPRSRRRNRRINLSD